MNNILRRLLLLYRGRIIGTLAGILFALVYLHFGFFRTLFIAVCAVAGYYVGVRLDADEDLRSLLDRLLPPID